MPYVFVYVYAMLAFTFFTLASPTPKHSSVIVANPLDRPLIVETTHGIASGQGLIAATTTRNPKAISTSSANNTAQGSIPTAFPSHVSFSQLQQFRWTSSGISNTLFGCLATFLGAATIGLTYYIYRRQSRSQRPDESVEMDNIQVFEPSDDDDALPIEDLPPPYTSVDASTGSLGQ